MLYLPWLSSLVEDEEVLKITLLQRKRNQLAGYCKLVIYGVMDLIAATDVFKHYSKVEMEMRPLSHSCYLLALHYLFALSAHIHIHSYLAGCMSHLVSKSLENL